MLRHLATRSMLAVFSTAFVSVFGFRVRVTLRIFQFLVSEFEFKRKDYQTSAHVLPCKRV